MRKVTTAAAGQGGTAAVRYIAEKKLATAADGGDGDGDENVGGGGLHGPLGLVSLKQASEHLAAAIADL